MNRATGFALLAALLLGGYLFFFERGERAADPEGEPVFAMPAEAVAAVSLERPGRPPVRLERESGAGADFADEPAADRAGGFTVREGEGPPAPADAAEVELLLQNLESLRFERRLPEETAADRGNFGLAEPDLTVRVERTPEAAEESEPTVVGFGAETPAPGNRYLEVGNGVVIVPAWTKDNFDRSAWDLRDKRVFRFDTAGITGLRLRAGDEEVALERRGGEWWIVRPFRFAADSYDASRLAAKVREAEMTGPVPDEPEAPESDPGSAGDGARFGLAPPRLSASFTVESPARGGNEVQDENEVPGADEATPRGDLDAGVRTVTIHFGGESATPPGVFARVEGEPAVFVVGQSLFDELLGSVGDRLAAVRSLRLFRFAAWKAVELRLEDPEGESVFRRRENEEGERVWVRESAAGAPTPADSEAASEADSAADSDAVEDLLYRLNSTDGEEIVAAPALPGPPGARFLTITVAEEDDPYGEETSPTAGRVETVRFRTPADGPPTALREGDERALRLTGEAMEEIRLLLAALDAPPASAPESADEPPERDPSPP